MVSRVDRGPVANWWWTVDRWLLAAFLALMVLGIVLNFFVPVTKYYFFVVLLSTVGAFFSLKRINKSKHPSFLFSYFSYRFLQDRKLGAWKYRQVIKN